MNEKINYNFKQINTYLTEQNFLLFLKDFLPEFDIIHDKKVPNSNIKCRPDFRIEEVKLIIEFNGIFHYTNPKTIVNDYKKRYIYSKMGYIVKSVPYWIQLRNDVIYYLFKDSLDIEFNKLKDYNLYKIGFIDENCPLPARFCSLGIKEMKAENKKWNEIIENYYKYFEISLIEKILKYDSFLNVANEEILPYFIKSWDNKNISWFNINYDNFQNITDEINFIKKYN